MKRIFYFSSAFCLLMACHSSVTVGDKKYDSDSGIMTIAQIQNNIQIKENGLKVSEAYLVDQSTGNRITNDIGKNDNISLRLVISGWKEVDSRVKPGASEKIAANDGKVVLDRPDLFSEMTDASAKDARFVTIDAEFKNMKTDYSGMDIGFRVWDKVSNAEVTGSYHVNLK
jgi:hypothetical protein